MLIAIDTAIPHRTAGTSSWRPLLRRYARLMATIRKASSPSRRVMTNACSMLNVDALENETQSQNSISVYFGISDRSSRLCGHGDEDNIPLHDQTPHLSADARVLHCGVGSRPPYGRREPVRPHAGRA